MYFLDVTDDDRRPSIAAFYQAPIRADKYIIFDRNIPYSNIKINYIGIILKYTSFNIQILSKMKKEMAQGYKIHLFHENMSLYVPERNYFMPTWFVVN